MPRECHECCATIYGGEGGVRAFGRLFCSEDCADAFEDGPEGRVWPEPVEDLYRETMSDA